MSLWTDRDSLEQSKVMLFLVCASPPLAYNHHPRMPRSHLWPQLVSHLWTHYPLGNYHLDLQSPAKIGIYRVFNHPQHVSSSAFCADASCQDGESNLAPSITWSIYRGWVTISVYIHEIHCSTGGNMDTSPNTALLSTLVSHKHLSEENAITYSKVAADPFLICHTAQVNKFRASSNSRML